MTWATLSTNRELVFHPGVPKYEDLRKAVDGYIEAVGIVIEKQKVTIYLNEEGKLDRLPPNYAATDLTNGILGWDVIVGNVVLVGGPDREGNDTSLSTATALWLNRRFAQRLNGESPMAFVIRMATAPIEVP
jgi:hypothetical protein